jgi:hypothetical protein
MDIDHLWQIVQDMNYKLGTVIGRLDWVEWWIRAIVGGTLLNAAISVGNLLLSVRNNRLNNKKAMNDRRAGVDSS